MYPNSGKVPCSVGCKSDCLVNSAESSLRSIHSSAYVRTLSWTSDIIIILWLSTNRLNRDSLSYRVISLSSWQKFGIHLMNGGQLFQWEFASEGWCDRSDRFKKAEIDPFSVVASFSFFFYRVCHQPMGCSSVSGRNNWMHCHCQEVCPPTGMSPEVSVRDEHFAEVKNT